MKAKSMKLKTNSTFISQTYFLIFW